MTRALEIGLMFAAVGQFCLAALNFKLVRIMHWEADLARISLLVRQVFRIHAWFISITLIIFSTLTWRFVHEIAGGSAPIYRWLACAIGIFWGIRLVLQATYYSSSHWRGIASRTVVHIILLIIYTGWTALYLIAGLQR